MWIEEEQSLMEPEEYVPWQEEFLEEEQINQEEAEYWDNFEGDE
jgi:hypothetical protein